MASLLTHHGELAMGKSVYASDRISPSFIFIAPLDTYNPLLIVEIRKQRCESFTSLTFCIYRQTRIDPGDNVILCTRLTLRDTES